MLLYPSACTRFLRESGARQTPSSIKSLRSHMAQLQDMHPTMHVTGFTEAHLREFCLAPTAKGPAAPNTIRCKRSNVTSFFSWAAYVGIVQSNPAANLKFTVRAPRRNVRQGHWLSEAQMRDVLNACPETPKGFRDRTLLSVGFMMGLRIEELCGLRWSKFTPDLTSVTFVGKGSKLATLGVPEQVRTALQAWRLTADEGTDTMWPACLWTGELQWRRPVATDAGRRAVQAAGSRVDLKLDPHDLRRTFANILEEKGVPIQVISKLLRHNDIGTTQRYLEQNPHKLAKVGQSLTFDL